jgi:hypothetical protein
MGSRALAGFSGRWWAWPTPTITGVRGSTVAAIGEGRYPVASSSMAGHTGALVAALSGQIDR